MSAEEEDNLSDASLIEEDDDGAEHERGSGDGPEGPIIDQVIDDDEAAMDVPGPESEPTPKSQRPVPPLLRASIDEENASSASSTIELPGDPITASAPDTETPSSANDEEPLEIDETVDDLEIDEGVEDDEDPVQMGVDPEQPEFSGFLPAAVTQASQRQVEFREFLRREFPKPSKRSIEATEITDMTLPPPPPPPVPSSAPLLLPPPPKLIKKPAHLTAGHTPGRVWKPSPGLFKPLELGWKREVIYQQRPDGSYDVNRDPEIIYHAPFQPGVEPVAFRQFSDMATYRKLGLQSAGVLNCLLKYSLFPFSARSSAFELPELLVSSRAHSSAHQSRDCSWPKWTGYHPPGSEIHSTQFESESTGSASAHLVTAPQLSRRIVAPFNDSQTKILIQPSLSGIDIVGKPVHDHHPDFRGISSTRKFSYSLVVVVGFGGAVSEEDPPTQTHQYGHVQHSLSRSDGACSIALVCVMSQHVSSSVCGLARRLGLRNHVWLLLPLLPAATWQREFGATQFMAKNDDVPF